MPWRDHIDVHPAADLFPMMSDDELKELAADIKKNGMKVPIVIQRGGTGDKPVLLDGRSRLEAIERFTDIKVEVNRLTGALVEHHKYLRMVRKGGDPHDIVCSLNIHRRHLTAEQKRELIGKLLKEQPTTSDRAISKLTKVSDKTVGAVRRELEGRAEIPHVETRTDTKGRRQRVHNSKSASVKAQGTAAEQSAGARQQPGRGADHHHAEPVQLPEQSAAARKAHYPAADEAGGIPEFLRRSPPSVPVTAPAEAATPEEPADGRLREQCKPPGECKPEAESNLDRIDKLTSEHHDQILHMMLVLLCTVDHKHRKKFHKHLTDNSVDGIYISSCSARGWANGGYAVDATVVRWIVGKLLASEEAEPCSVTVTTVVEPPKPRKRRTKDEIAAAKAQNLTYARDIADGLCGGACVMAAMHREGLDGLGRPLPHTSGEAADEVMRDAKSSVGVVAS